MELFDKKFVYFMWDDSLKGKKGFLADSIPSIIDMVENHGPKKDKFRSVHSYNKSGNKPFTAYGAAYYTFFYHDPLYEYKWAWKNGKRVEVYGFVGISRAWIEVTDDWKWKENYEYRIKPEEPKKKWRPFKDVQELKQTWLAKNDAKSKGDLYELFVWVRFKNYRDASKLIVGFDKKLNKVCVAGTWFNLSELHEHCEFLDGSPCGVEE